MQDNSEERNRCGCLGEAAGVQSDVGDVVHILPAVSITAGGHHLVVVFGEVLKRLDRKVLTVLTVVGFILIEVGIQIRTERGNRNSDRVILQIVLGELLIEVAEVCRGKCKLKVADVGLLGRTVFPLAGITVINGLDSVLFQADTVKHGVLLDEHEIEVREQLEALLLGVGSQLFKVHAAFLGGTFPFQVVRRSRRGHTALGVTGHDEVDVRHALVRQIVIHRFDVGKGGQRRHDVDRDRQELFGGLESAEGLDVKRNIRRNIRILQSRQRTVGFQIIPVGFRHAHVGALVVIGDSFVCGNLGVGQHNVTDLVVTGVLTGRYHRPGAVLTY